MKRVGHLMERMMTEENFINAEKQLGKNKRDNRQAVYFSRHAEKYGKIIFDRVSSGEFRWHKPRLKTITDSYKGKTRNLKIPCLEDQVVQLAWLAIATPYIERRNYYYNCGSIPKAGQTRCVDGLRKWLRNKRYKYGATSDIRKFYESCPHSAVRKGLCRIFKDKAFVEFAMGFVSSMSDDGVGIAIGYPSSHWLANVVLMMIDHEIKRRFPQIKYTRYMDDVAMVSANKRQLRKALDFLKEQIESLGMHLKRWNLIVIKNHGLGFLSYRFFHKYTLLKKQLMIRIARRMKRAKDKMCLHVAYGVISYFGILKRCDSYHFRTAYVYPYINRRACIRMISESMRNVA